MKKSYTPLEHIEFQVLVSAIKLRYGHDFERYASKSLMRRMFHYIKQSHLDTLSDLIPVIMHDESVFMELLESVSVPVTEMFRDTQVFSLLRQEIIPLLKTYPNINIWHAGCSTGEEVYSMAIMLEEEGLYDKCKIFATDFNSNSLDKAQQGLFPFRKMKQYTESYYQAGGKLSFSEHYTVDNHMIKMNANLSRNITFAKHNLMEDNVFGQFHLILCRNVLIYFGRELQNRVLTLFQDSMLPLGYLCLGLHESIEQASNQNNFQRIFESEKIYRKRI